MASNITRYPPDVVAPDGTILKSPFYNYLLTEWVCILFVVLYGITAALHFGQALYFRMWFLLPTACLAGVGEVIGWSGRVWSSISPLLKTPFLIQIVATILAPTPFLAAIFILFARVTGLLGTQYSRLSPKWYSRVFLSCDFISLIVQGVGGGMAASAQDTTSRNLGANIMLGGIIFQFASLIIFTGLSIEYMIRYTYDIPIHRARAWSSDTPLAYKATWNTKFKAFLGGLTFITACILVRSIYRLIELSEGWNGPIISTQLYFNVLDGAMIVLSLFALDVFHPGYFLKGQKVTRRLVNRGSNDDEIGGASTEEIPLSNIQHKIE